MNNKKNRVNLIIINNYNFYIRINIYDFLYMCFFDNHAAVFESTNLSALDIFFRSDGGMISWDDERLRVPFSFDQIILKVSNFFSNRK